MSHTQMLAAVGLIRTSQRRGFCPARRLFQTRGAPREIAAPALIALAFLIVAALGWAVTIARMGSIGDMTMGLGSIGPFVAGWSVMMAAMMLPSAMPLVFEFARNAEGRRSWQAATALLGVTYLSLWLGVAATGGATEMSLSTYMYAFGLQPDRRAEFVEWARTTGVPFWLTRPGLRTYRTYGVCPGSGASVAGRARQRRSPGSVLDSPEWAKILSEFQSYVTDLPSWVLGAVATGGDPPRPTPQGLGEARERETVAPTAATRRRVSASADWVIRMGLSTHPCAARRAIR